MDRLRFNIFHTTRNVLAFSHSFPFQCEAIVIYFDDLPISLTSNPGGRDCLNLAAFSLSLTFNVYKYRLHRTLNLTVLSFFFMILTDLASFLLAVRRKSLISLISRAMLI